MRTHFVSLALCLTTIAACGSSSEEKPEFGVLLDDIPGAILSFWGDSKENLYAVGGDLGDPSAELILWHDGTTWNRMDADAPTLWWVHGFGQNDVWAVGEAGTIIHYNGSEWTTEQTGEEYTLWGIWGASSDDLWAVGGEVTHAVPAILLHYDGNSWTEETSMTREGDMYFKIWGSGASDIWAISQKGVIIHYDGSTWAEVESNTTKRLVTINGRAPDDIWAVGGDIDSVLIHYDGVSWQPVEVDFGGGLMGVWAGPGEELFVSGFRGIIAWGKGDLEMLDAATTQCLHATWGDAEGNIIAGGGNLITGSSPTGVIVGSGDGIASTWTDI